MGYKPVALWTGVAPPGLCLLQQQGYARGFPALRVRKLPHPRMLGVLLQQREDEPGREGVQENTRAHALGVGIWT